MSSGILETTPRIHQAPPAAAQGQAVCRFCAAALSHTFVDLGSSPLCQRHVTPEQLNSMEPFYPLNVWVCDQCWLVQLEEYVSPAEIFNDYAYFSSFSTSWLEHARQYTQAMTQRFGLETRSRVVELASNDGYLLQYFKSAGIGVVGIEPAANVAEAARAKGIPTITEFFGVKTANSVRQSHGPADLLLGNNVLAHVPDINDFVGGMKLLLAERGIITMEFPHLVQLMQHNQFDTIYHEHFSYLSLTAVEKVFAAHGLTIFDVEELSTHGGSLRMYARHEAHRDEPVTPRVSELRGREADFGITRLSTYATFGEQVRRTKRRLLEFLIQAKDAGQTVVGYGAPGKGNTLLNYCGIRTDFVDYTVDRNPKKQGNFLPGTRIPIRQPDAIAQTRPDFVLILPWNLREEIAVQLSYIREWGGRFVVPIPELEVFWRVVLTEARTLESKRMKVVLFCGGLGLRIREAGENIPKPMVPIGYRPIMWHLMRYYAHYGHKDFVLCLGHRGDAIKRYFLDYDECISNDFVLANGGKSIKLLSSDTDNWTITFVDTGTEANIGQRLRAVRKHLDGEEMFLANYADNLSDVSLPAVIEQAERDDKLATFVTVRPSQTFHIVRTEPDGSAVSEISPVTNSDIWMNGGFFVLKQAIFDHLHEGDELVVECFQRLIQMRQLSTYRHDGFWHAMDTFKEKMALEDLYAHGKAPWEVWHDRLKPPAMMAK